MPTTMPAIAPPERLESEEEEAAAEGEEPVVGFARALGVTVSWGEESDVGMDEGEAEEVLALSGALDMVPKYEEMDPICVNEAEGTGVLSCVSVDRLCGPGAWTVKFEGCWQLSSPSRLTQQFHCSFVVS